MGVNKTVPEQLGQIASGFAKIVSDMDAMKEKNRLLLNKMDDQKGSKMKNKGGEK